VLEYGCGLGVALPTLARLAKQVVAVDTDVSGGKHMAQLYGIENIRFIDKADQLTRLVEEIAPGSIDCVTALDVFEHIDDLEPVVRLLDTILSSRGRVIISGPTDSWAYRLGRRLLASPRLLVTEWKIPSIRRISAASAHSSRKGVSGLLLRPFCLFGRYPPLLFCFALNPLRLSQILAKCETCCNALAHAAQLRMRFQQGVTTEIFGREL